MIPSHPPQCQRLLRSRAGAWTLAAGFVLAPALQAPAAAGGSGDLLDVYTRALDSNPQYQAAIAGFHATSEVKPQALAKLLPQLGAGSSFGELEQAVSGQFFKDVLSTGTGNGVNVNHRDQFYSAAYQVELQQVLFDWSLFKGYDKSDLQVGQAAVKVYEALDGLRLQTAQDYFDVLAAQDGVRFAKAEKDAIGDLLGQTRNKLSSGLVTNVEVEQVQTDYDLSDAALIDAQNTLEVSLTQLQLLTGGQSYKQLRPLPAGYQPQLPDPNRMDVWVERAQTQNLLLQDKHYGTEIARKQIEIQKAARLPTLEASAKRTYAYAPGGITNGIEAGENHELDEGVFLNLKVPIYTGGAIDSGIRAAEADYDRAQQEEAGARNDARHNAQVAFLNVTSGLIHIAALKQAMQSAAAAEDAARAGYGAGTKTYTDVLLALRNRYRAERDYAQARDAYVVNFVKLKQAAGALSHADLMTVSRWLQ